MIKLSREEAALAIGDFIEGRGGPHDWDDFISIPIRDRQLDAIRVLCAMLPDIYKPAAPNQYCGEGGIAFLAAVKTFLSESDAS